MVDSISERVSHFVSAVSCPPEARRWTGSRSRWATKSLQTRENTSRGGGERRPSRPPPLLPWTRSPSSSSCPRWRGPGSAPTVCSWRSLGTGQWNRSATSPTQYWRSRVYGRYREMITVALNTFFICTFPDSQVKAQVWLKAVTSNISPDFYQRFSPDHCILLYQKKGNVCEIYDKHQVFQTLDCIRYWRGTDQWLTSDWPVTGVFTPAQWVCHCPAVNVCLLCL